MKRRLATAALTLLFALQGASAQQRPPRAQPAPAPPAAAPQPAPTPAPEPPGPIYEARLLRLAEILGALTFLSDLCAPVQGTGAAAAEEWRGRMRDLIEAEAQSKTLKERLAGAYNKGVIGYQGSYRTCTASGRLAMERLMAEGAAIAHDLAGRYGS